jgi:hypothetical protein
LMCYVVVKRSKNSVQMNRVEKEIAKKRAKEREGLSDEEIVKLGLYESLVNELHFELFPEEYDCMMDSIADARDRRRGKNPMHPQYTEKVNNRLREMKIPPLSSNGLPTNNSSWDFAKKEAKRRLA